MNTIAWGATIGGLASVGVIVLALALSSRASLSERVLPFVRTFPESSTTPDVGTNWSSPGWTFGDAGDSWWRHVLRVAIGHATRILDATFGAASAQRRLLQLGVEPNVERFRMDQLRWSVLAMAGMTLLGCARAVAGNPIAPLAWLALTAISAIGAACACDYRLSRAAKARCRRIAEELPSIAELLAFSVAAGLAPLSALGRVVHRSSGELATELRRCTDEVASGRRFADALGEASRRMNVPSVTQFIDALVVAMERGTPLAEVLRAQAMDARAVGHRELMEQAGKREILAMIPVVFLILPMVIVIAIFPGIHGLLVTVP